MSQHDEWAEMNLWNRVACVLSWAGIGWVIVGLIVMMLSTGGFGAILGLFFLYLIVRGLANGA